MKKASKQLKEFPEEVIEAMLQNQVLQGNKKNIKVFQDDNQSLRYEGGFNWADTKEGLNFWGKVINERDFNVFFNRYPIEKKLDKTIETVAKTNPGIYRMNRTGVFYPFKHTKNQCGQEGNNSYSYVLTIIVNNKLDKDGFIIDHDTLNKAIINEKIFGSCEEMQLIIHKAIINVMPEGVLLGYKCVIRPLDFTPQAFIEFIECSNPQYFSLL